MDQASAPQAAPQGAQAPDQDGGEDQIVQGMMMVKDALSAMTDNLSGQIPPAAAKALQMAKQAYDQFLSSSGMPTDQDSQGMQDPNTAGKGNVVPADQPMKA